LVAWFFDTLVVVTCLIAGFTLSASVPFMGLLAHKFPSLFQFNPNQIVQAGSLGWMVLMTQTLTVAAIMMFLVQAFSGILFSASVGRAIVNVQISAGRSVFLRGLKIGFGELVQWPLGFGLLNAIVSPEHNFIIRSLRWNRAGSAE
jgi:MFS family permease